MNTIIKFITIFLLIMTFSCQQKPESNDAKNNVEDLQVPPPPKKNDRNNLIGFSCNESGSMSEPVTAFSQFLKKNDYESIRHKLVNSSAAEKYLATVLCENLEKRALIKVTDQERKLIEYNKKSNELVTICSGCTHRDELSLKELFDPKKNYCSIQLEEWFNEITN